MSETKQTTAQILKDYGMLTIATLLMCIGIYFFKFPNNFSTGGVSGISIILGHYVPNLSAGAFVFIINQLLLILGFLIFGRSFGIRTAYVSLLMSGVIWGLEYICPMDAPLTTQPLLELVFAVAFPAIGSAIMFNMQASSGGTDIVAMILKKKTNINIGNCLLMVDFSITVIACIAFGFETGLFSMLGLALKSVIVDMVLENIKVHKCFQIITSKPDEIVQFIVGQLHRGATEINGEGAFTHENKTVILTVVNRAQAIQLRLYAKNIDPTSFILITNTTEIIGKGFRGVM
ncbi:MAG: YitT family protein [Eubacteriales bacterium]|nr:YitT family protein [Eubacteriales bacterium]